MTSIVKPFAMEIITKVASVLRIAKLETHITQILTCFSEKKDTSTAPNPKKLVRRNSRD